MDVADVDEFKDTSLIRKRHPVGPNSRTMPRALGGPRGVGEFLWARCPCMHTKFVCLVGVAAGD